MRNRRSPGVPERIRFQPRETKGYEYAFIKASEGPYRDGSVYVPSGLEDFVDRAKASEMITGYYHFLVQSHASDHVSSGRMQADHFLRTIEGRGGIDDRLLCADFEAYNRPTIRRTPT